MLSCVHDCNSGDCTAWASRVVGLFVRSFCRSDAVLSSANMQGVLEISHKTTKAHAHIQAVVAAATISANTDVYPGVNHRLQRSDAARQLAVGDGAGRDTDVGGLKDFIKQHSFHGNRTAHLHEFDVCGVAVHAMRADE